MLNIQTGRLVTKYEALVTLLKSWVPPNNSGKDDLRAIYNDSKSYEQSPNVDGILPNERQILCYFETLVTCYIGRKVGDVIG